ncbi:MAG: SpoIVB peptidase [Oscillospiraceae bacterium]|jgi:stage IV sporulation protein B|nr:SpoIVB peptidase [Oscillospiraceae bacterium]
MRKIITIFLCFILLSPVPAQAARDPVLPESVIPGGHTLGVKLQTDGLMVVGMAPVNTYDGKVSPAGDAGIVSGDMITHIQRRSLATVADLLALTDRLSGEALEVTYIRDGKMYYTTLVPAKSADDGRYRLGVWVRDSMAGIGTITFYDPDTGLFGALGHGINEAETGRLLPMGSGHVLYSEVESVRQGLPGTPGELKGKFRDDKAYGHLLRNTESGLFGTLTTGEAMGKAMEKPVAIAPSSEVRAGKAVILSNVTGDTVERFDIEIIKIFNGDDCRNFMIRVTDERLLTHTGGIVQGMSGSPVLQNGRLVGAVTHVLINDPERGYGIFAESMLREGMRALDAQTWREAEEDMPIAA